MINSLKKILFVTVMFFVLTDVVQGKAICFGQVSEQGKCGGWRYLDADFFGQPRVEKTILADGKQGYAAVMRTSMKNAGFILLTTYFGTNPKVSKNTGLKVVYHIPADAGETSLFARISTNEPGGKRGRLSDEKVKLKGMDIGNNWRSALLPSTAFNCKPGTGILRVYVIPENSGVSKDDKLYVREISIIDDPSVAQIKPDHAASKKQAQIPVKGSRYCAIFPKPFWYTDKKTFYAPEVYREIYQDGFNVMGVPGTSTYSLPKDLPERVERFIETGREIAKYPGMQAYPKMTMCWKFPLGGEHYDRMVWFNGYQQQLVCPADERYWTERIIPYCSAYAKASLEVPVFAIMLDWEIYPVGKKFRGGYGICYCDSCWRRFLEQSGVKAPKLAFSERNPWLMTKDLRFKYSSIFYERMSRLGRKLRQATDKLNPRLSYWFIPNVSDAFSTTLARALASKEAPVVVSDEGTYGKASLALSDAEGVETNVSLVRNDIEYLRKTKIQFIYLAAIMGDQGPGFHGQQAVAMAEQCNGIWLWELAKVADYKYGRDKLMNVMRVANREIRQGTFKIMPQWKETNAVDKIIIPEGKYGIALSGIGASEFSWPSNAHTVELPEISSESLNKMRLVILQNFNAPLTADSSTVKRLRQYVKAGGRLFLAHDTGFFMSSPFPEIVKGAFLPREKGDSRHILDVKMKIAEKCPETPHFAGKLFEADFNDHLVFANGPDGRILVTDRYGYPVIIVGDFGLGKVVYSGCYYRKMGKDKIETKFIESLIAWLWK